MDDLLILFRLLGPFVLLVFVLPVIHDLAYGRLRHGGDLNQIKPCFFSQIPSLRELKNAQLLTFCINDTNLVSPDAIVDGYVIRWFCDYVSPTVV